MSLLRLSNCIFQRTESLEDITSVSKMQIQLLKNENGLEEWLLIDMQGEINNSNRPFDGEMLGNLGWRKDNSEALLLIGHHLVEGKVISLERPYIVAAPKDHNGKKVLYVEAVVRRKLVFKLRPKPIVTKHLMKRSEFDKKEQEKENEDLMES